MYINDAELAGTMRFYLIARFMLYPDSLYRGTTCNLGQDIITLMEISVATNVINFGPVCTSVDQVAKTVPQPTWRRPFSAKDDIVRELESLITANIIETVKEALARVSPIVPVRKSSGTLC